MGTPLRKKGVQPHPQLSAHVYCGQTSGWIKMVLGMEVCRPEPRRLCVRWGPSPSPQKGGGAPVPHFFGPCLLWPNGRMDQDGTWHGGRPQPRRLCIRCGPRGLCVRWEPSSPPEKGGGAPPQFSAHVYCGQTAGWIKTPLGTEVDLGPGHFVLDGFPAIGERGHGRPSQLLLSSCSNNATNPHYLTTHSTTC